MSVAGAAWFVSPSENRLVPCADSLCTALHSGQNQKCPSPKQCDYQIKYTDNASSTGVLVADNFSLPLRNSSNVRPSLTFGYSLLIFTFGYWVVTIIGSSSWCRDVFYCLYSCGYDQQVGKNGAVQAATDGLLGLGRGSIGLLSQLKKQGITKNVLGHCLSTSGGGFLFFGDDMVPTSRVTWVPMARSSSGYSIFSKNLFRPCIIFIMNVSCDTDQTRVQSSILVLCLHC